ncbi:2-aminoethylphosphonate ABC transporter substrate-binding protein [Streptomyces sp. ICBB 8177]|uniref:2-aminoethylphosphonate ABC transporter substrate-binding protein n=1 Tax=Streptomyces sp. ICBB 8177 TaxID=563922 RepID=UPI000D67D5EC|nr:2-aminoethylphosphonate ABC transporter substrate-binding protein [Streptomyces sp. ICBB 8177]PWI44888.1 2-aminoethylphosphonate ABC transporter substrate-binding protein [Streptomyces sp. ICBB 8177]
MPRHTVTAVLTALVLGASLTACAGQPSANAREITVYSADGLKSETGDGFYNQVFKDFQARTGIRVDYVEGGSGEMVQRLARERSNTQADVVVTLPPFIQEADSKGLLAAYRPQGSAQVPAADKAADGTWTSVVDNYLCFIYDKKQLPQPPKTWNDLLEAKFKGKLQYSTPGVAGDGTAVLVKAMHDFGGESRAMAFLKKLQAVNVGPSSSTGALAAKVDKGELLVANGDVQMNYADTASMPDQGIFFPAPNGGGAPTTLSLPYAAGLVKNAPHAANARKFLDYLLSPAVQQEVSRLGGGFASRTDVRATDANAQALAKIMSGVQVFRPDWNAIDDKLTDYVDAWQSATGS